MDMDLTDWIKGHSWALAPAYIIVLALYLWIKSKLFKTIEIKPIDVGIVLIPFVLWMTTAGIFKKVEVSGLISIEAADVIVSAAAEPIKLQISKIPVTALKADAKKGVSEIPKMIKDGTQVLSFKLGYKNYYGPAVWKYFNHLIKSPSFKYVLITNKNGHLFGVIEARKLTALFNPENNISLMNKYKLESERSLPKPLEVKKWNKFTTFIINSNKLEISRIPGFVSLNVAVKSTENKQKVLAKMEKYGYEWLPVVKNEGDISRFQGVVERSRLTASLILDVARQLGEKKKDLERNSK